MGQDNKQNQSEKVVSNGEKNEYRFGGITEYNLEDIEAEVLNDNVYLDVFAGSDVRFKEGVEAFSGALNIISTLGVYKYNYKTNEFLSKKFPNGEQIGVMAQEIEVSLPQLVKKDDEGYRYVNYSGLSPVLLSGIQELVTITKKQSDQIQKMEETIKNLENSLKAAKGK